MGALAGLSKLERFQVWARDGLYIGSLKNSLVWFREAYHQLGLRVLNSLATIILKACLPHCLPSCEEAVKWLVEVIPTPGKPLLIKDGNIYREGNRGQGSW